MDAASVPQGENSPQIAEHLKSARVTKVVICALVPAFA